MIDSKRKSGEEPRAIDEEDMPDLQALMQDEKVSTKQICERFGVSKVSGRMGGGNGEEHRR